MQSRHIFSPSSKHSDRKYSISDDVLDIRGYSVHSTISDLNIDHLKSLFESVKSPPRQSEQIKKSLEEAVSVIWIEHKPTHKPVAFARAIHDKLLFDTTIHYCKALDSDGVSFASIYDVAVHRDLQRRGLGTAVMERLLQDLFDRGVTHISLLCLLRVVNFYKHLGFVVVDDGGKDSYSTMVRKLERRD